MIRTLIAVVALAVFLPLTAQAQEWTAEQQEIWEFEKACWDLEELEAGLACFHEDFIGWGTGELSVPTSKADRRALRVRALETQDATFLLLKPLDIKVHGNVAVVVYIATGSNKNKATGEETNFTQRWTDIALKEGDTWTWIADHGESLGEDN